MSASLYAVGQYITPISPHLTDSLILAHDIATCLFFDSASCFVTCDTAAWLSRITLVAPSIFRPCARIVKRGALLASASDLRLANSASIVELLMLDWRELFQ